MTAHLDRRAHAGRCRTPAVTPPEGAIMLTLPVEAGRAAANRPARILVIGRSETVLSEAVTILREKGYAAGATNEFDRTLDLFDAGQLDLLFGGMVPPDTKEHLRGQISARNPAAAFVQGYAGIPDSSQSRPRPPSAAAQPDPPPQSPTTPSPGRSASPSTDHRASPSSPGGPPRSSPRNRKHLTSNSGRGTPHRRAHHRDPG